MKQNAKAFKQLIGFVTVIAFVLSAAVPASTFAAEANASAAGVNGAPEEHIMFSSNFEEDTVGSKLTLGSDKKKWSAQASSAESTIFVVDDGGNKVVELARVPTVTGKGYPRLERRQGINEQCKVVIDFKIKIPSGIFALELRSSDSKNTNFTKLIGMNSSTVEGGGAKTKYADVRAVLDFSKKTFSTMINGKTVEKAGEIVSGLDYSQPVLFRFTSTLNPGEKIYLDDFLVTTNNADVAENKTTLTVTTDTPLIPHLKQSHPRLLLNDFEPVRQKIKADSTVASWYEVLKRYADSKLDVAPSAESTSTDNTVHLTISREVMHIVYALAMVYQVERDDKYKDRLWKELESVGKFKEWRPSSFLTTAETSHAFAIAYDWLYNDFTEEQKAFIREAIVKKGLEPGVTNYSGTPTGTNWAAVTHNWNAVCNSSMIMAALAIADEEPKISEFIFDKASASMKNGLKPYNPIGAYPEGIMYWTYGTSYLTYVMAALDTAVKDGEMPDKFAFYKSPGISETADFPIYMATPTGRVNFGDANSSKSGGGPIMYWFAKKFNKPQYAWYERPFDAVASGDSNNWDKALDIIWYDPAFANATADFALDKAFASENGEANSAVLRNSWTDPNANVIALQGGNNKANHQYLSLGTFMIEAMGQRWATMRGAGNYDWPNYFSAASEEGGRWQYYIARAEGQNTLVINPTAAADQVTTATARVVEFEASETDAFSVVDLTAAYKDVSSVKRGIRLTDNKTRFIVQDEIKAKAAIKAGYWFMHTNAKIRISEDGKSAMLYTNGKKMWVNILEGPASAKFMVMDAKPLSTSPSPAVQPEHYGKKLAIKLDGEKDIKLAIEMVPLQGDQAPPASMGSSPNLSAWKIADSAVKPLATRMGSAVSLFINSPYAYSKGYRTYVDKDNLDVRPVIRDGSTLVPVRFISENFGAQVGWEDATQTVTVNYQDKNIALKIGSTSMTVNGQEQTLPVPAQTINDRTFLPLRALVEALGKNVFWDDRGLVLISDKKNVFDATKHADTVNELVDTLKSQLTIDGKPVEFFNSAVDSIDVVVSGDAAHTVGFSAFEEGASVDVKQAVAAIGTAQVVVTEKGVQKTYSVNLIADSFDTGEIELKGVVIAPEGVDAAPKEKPYLDVVDFKATRSDPNPPRNAFDNDLSTKWTAADEQWIQYDFGKTVTVNSMAVAVADGTARKYNFQIEKSDDGETWTEVKKGLQTSGKGDMPELFELGDISTRYIKYKGFGNSVNTWNSITELRYYESAEKATKDKAEWETSFAKNPTYKFKVGAKINLQAKGLAEDKSLVELTNAEISYTTDKPNVASISNSGELTVKGKGEATITTSVSVNSIVYSVKIIIIGE